MFTAITVTRTILRIVVTQEWARKARLYGISEDGIHRIDRPAAAFGAEPTPGV